MSIGFCTRITSLFPGPYQERGFCRVTRKMRPPRSFQNSFFVGRYRLGVLSPEVCLRPNRDRSRSMLNSEGTFSKIVKIHFPIRVPVQARTCTCSCFTSCISRLPQQKVCVCHGECEKQKAGPILSQPHLLLLSSDLYTPILHPHKNSRCNVPHDEQTPSIPHVQEQKTPPLYSKAQRCSRDARKSSCASLSLSLHTELSPPTTPRGDKKNILSLTNLLSLSEPSLLTF